MEDTMPKIEFNGVSLHYEISGKPSAPVLMFSNSLGTTLDMWEPQIAECERQFQILRYDMRGHGQSSTPAGPYSIEALGRDVLVLLDALSLERVHFCGLSIGGVIGQWLGIHAPSRLRKLVLCNTAAKIGTADTWNARISTVEREGMAAIIDAIIARWFTAPFLATGTPVIGAMRQMLISVDPAGYVAACAAIRDMDQREEVASIQTPTLVIGGEYDPVTTIHDARFLEGRIIGARFVSLPAGHISNAEVPAQFNAALLNFLTSDSHQDGAE
jgi:3-oxoadipate enol-lactonase